jgi:GTPase SAR1 family protein
MAKNDYSEKSTLDPALLRTVTGHQGKVRMVAITPDGQLAVSSSYNLTLKVWNLKTGETLRILEGHTDLVWGVAITPDGQKAISSSRDRTLKVWDIKKGSLVRTLEGHTDLVWGVAITPDGQKAISSSRDRTLKVWDIKKGSLVRTLENHMEWDMAIAITPNGQSAVSGGISGTLKVWDLETGTLLRTLEGHSHTGWVTSVAISPDGQMVVSGSGDQTLKVWDLNTGALLRILEGHTDGIRTIAITSDGQMVVSGSDDWMLRVWDLKTGTLVRTLEGHKGLVLAVAITPDGQMVVSGSDDWTIKIWDLKAPYKAVQPSPSLHRIITAQPATSVQYTNAKVVLVGDSGVGKTGLSLVMTGQQYIPTESSHGRRVWTLANVDAHRNTDGDKTAIVQRETLLWDLAGQPGYRLFHRLHLHDAAVGVVVFDARSETEPFVGVEYWARALDQATAHGNFPAVKLLVAARIDRTGPPAGKERISEIVKRLGFAGYYETSAKRCEGIKELRRAIGEAIRWNDLPIVTTPNLFDRIKDFLIAEKETGRVMAVRGDLLEKYQRKYPDAAEAPKAFETCLRLLEGAGLIRGLAYEDLILLQPELLDNYCASLALAARAEPDGLGDFPEERALKGDFAIDKEERIQDKAMEPAMLLATIQEAVAREVAVRQPTAEGVILVFPSELRKDFSDFPGDRTLAVAFEFDGPISTIYATLAVSLIHSISFKKKELYKNAALFVGLQGMECGFVVEYPYRYNDAHGRLTVFFDDDTQRDCRLLFLRYVNRQLENLALEGSVWRERIYQCPADGYLVPPDAVTRRKERRETTVICGDCGRFLPMDDLVEEAQMADDRVDQLAAQSDEERDRQSRLTILNKLEQLRQYHTFLCHNTKDKKDVLVLWQKLRDKGIAAWMDKENILGGDQFIPELEEVIENIPSALVIVGPHGMGRWEEQEYYALLIRYVEYSKKQERRLRLIPVLLPGVSKEPELPVFLRGFDYIDFRTKKGLDDLVIMRELVHAILEERWLY